MEKGVIVYSSVSVVHRARKLLKKKKLDAAVIQLPSDLGLKGCSYALECPRILLEEILTYSAEKGLKIKAAFAVQETENGRVYTAYDLS